MKLKAEEILNKSIIIDVLWHAMLDDPPLECTKDKTIVDLLLEGGVNTVSTTIIADTYGETSFTDGCKAIYDYYLLEETLPSKVKIIKNSEDIFSAAKDGKLGVIMSTQGSEIVEQDLRFITIVHKLGLRIMQITYNQKGSMGCGVYEPNDTGLTRLGQQSIYEMNRLGILIDLSHVGHKTSLDTIEVSNDPVIFSHSSVKKICNHPRNVTDEQIKALADKGGVLGLCPHSVMCSNDCNKQPDVNTFIDHMVYVANLVGVEHIGIGTDRFVRPTLHYMMSRKSFERTLPGFFGPYDGFSKHVKGFNYMNDWENLIENMIKRNFTEDEIRKIIGLNLIRVFKQVWDKNL